MDSGVIDLAAGYECVLARAGVYCASELAEQIIPSDMTRFLSRWPVALKAASEAISIYVTEGPEIKTASGGWVFYQAGEYRLRCALKPRRIKDYLVFEEHKRKSME